MSYEDPLDKDRLFFTQNNSLIRVKCPECLRVIKNPRQTPVFKKLPALWWHFKRDHGEVSNLLFTTKDIQEVLNGLSKAIDLGILPPEAKPEVVRRGSADTATSSLNYNGRPARKDVVEKLAKMAGLFRGQSYDYPVFKLKHLKGLVKVVLGQVDERTQQKYLNCVIDASAKNIRNGTIDVTSFCDKAGV